AATRICAHVRNRGLQFRKHYQSLNSIAYLWAWYFVALRWRQQRTLNELAKDSLEKGLGGVLDARMDRWLICSQWANVWTSSSTERLSGYAKGLASCAQAAAEKLDVGSAVAVLGQQLESDVKSLEQGAV